MGKPHKELAQFLIAGAEEANASGNETALVKVRSAVDPVATEFRRVI